MLKNNSFFSNVNGVCLDKSQIKIIKSKRKNILVLAGAGSGKTLTIVAKVSYLIDVLKVEEKDILCISFTNDAVNKLKKDLNRNVDVFTFHKLGLKIIGKQNEVLTENMLMDIIISTFKNDALFGLFDMNKTNLYKLVNTFITLFKSNNYKLKDFDKFISKANHKEKLLLKEIMKCYICYQSYLRSEGLIDFSDMINVAIKKLDKSIIKYKYIIIDEYQDISYTKYLFIKKIKEIGKSYIFAVGDDFQSIYRFAGSNVNLITNFKKYFPFAKIYKLKNTYRNSYDLIKIAGKFIMKNPFQIRKKIKSKIKLKDSINVVYYDDLKGSMNDIIDTYKIKNLLILSRNNYDLNNINLEGINYRKMTIHKSKGLEEEYVFIINLKEGLGGFPNKNIDHKILRFVNNYKEYYKYEEERRLFYVALTRCRKKVFLFCPYDNVSSFVKELLKINKKIKIINKKN